MTESQTVASQPWLAGFRDILKVASDVRDWRYAAAAGWRALAAADRRRAAAELTHAERDWLRAVLDEALGVDLRSVTEPGAWATAAESLAWDVRYLRDRVEALGIVEWASPTWAQLTAAETLLDTVRDELASPPPTGGVDDVDDDAAILAGLDAATGSSPDHPRVEELEGEERVNPTDERAALVAALRPRIHDALDEAVAGLSLPELRALAAHPDAMAALLLLAGLAVRAEAAIPEGTPEAAAQD